MKKRTGLFLPAIILFFAFCFFTGCASRRAITAEEYFALGMAFFDLERWEDAERWLNRARQFDRTMTASSYNLGRIAFERGRFREAAGHFESILRLDPDNVIALRASAYTRIRTGDLDIAERHYTRLLTLIPESADDGYNHALVLFAMERFEDAQEVIERHPFAILDNSDVILLYARVKRALGNIEAINTFERWLNTNTDRRIRFEYAQLLEEHEFFARALEEYRLAISETSADAADPTRAYMRFYLARLLLIADSENTEGITELQTAVNEGFNDIDLVEELNEIAALSFANRNSLRTILNDMQRAAEELERDLTLDHYAQDIIEEDLFLQEDYTYDEF